MATLFRNVAMGFFLIPAVPTRTYSLVVETAGFKTLGQREVPLRSSVITADRVKAMPITPANPFKGRQYSGEVILLAVRWYLRYPLAYEHVAELLGERGLEVDASCIWRWVQVYAPEINNRCRPHLKPTNKPYRVDETYI